MKASRRSTPPRNPGVGKLVHDKRKWSVPLSKDAVERGFLGWHENGYLPHRDEPGLVQFVTFRLADSFPTELRAGWSARSKLAHEGSPSLELDDYLDAGYGECLLKQPEIARIVEASLMHFHDARYDLRGWVVMPNHVHVLFQTRDVPMCLLVDAWKGFTAKEANKSLGRKGKFWQDGYWDTYMRNEEQERRTRTYVESNPVKARLVTTTRDWAWSSARYRDANERLAMP